MTYPVPGAARWLKRLYAFESLVLLVIVVALVLMARTAFKDPASVLAAFATPGLASIAANTACIALGTGALVVTLSYALAYFLHVYASDRWARLLVLAFLFPYIASYYFVLLGWRALWQTHGLVADIFPDVAQFVQLLNYGVLALVTVMVLRYLPLATALIYFRMRNLPVTQIQAARNLGLGVLSIHGRIFLPWTLRISTVTFLFTTILCSLDILANSIVGGNQVQILANVIDDWHRTQQLQGAAMAMGLAYIVAVLAMILLCRGVFRPASQFGTSTSKFRQRLGVEGTLLLAVAVGVAALDILVIAGVLHGALPLSEALRDLHEQTELWSSLRSSLRVAILAAAAATCLAMVSAFSRHIRNSLRPRTVFVEPGELIILLPLIVPPILAGVAGGHLQFQVFNTVGSSLSVAVAHLVVYGPLSYFVMSAGLGALPPHAYQVACNLGIDRRTYLCRIFLPTVALAAAAGAFLVFAFSMNDPVIARYVGGFDRLLGVFIGKKQISVVDPALYLVVFAMPLLTLGILLLLSYLAARYTLLTSGPAKMQAEGEYVDP